MMGPPGDDGDDGDEWQIPGPAGPAGAGASSHAPTAKVGATAVTGTALTFMTSDSAPPIDLTFTPTMTGAWIFTPAAGVGVTINAFTGNSGLIVNAVAGQYAEQIVAASGARGLLINAGALSTDYAMRVQNAAASLDLLVCRSDGSGYISVPSGNAILTWNGSSNLVFGNATDNNAFDFAGGGTGTVTGPWTFTPTGGQAITINAYINNWGMQINGSSTSGDSYGLFIQAGTTAADTALYVRSQSGAQNFLNITGAGDGTVYCPWVFEAASGVSVEIVGFTGNNALRVTGAASVYAQVLTGVGAAGSGTSFGLAIVAGTTASDVPFVVQNQAASIVFLEMFGDGHATVGGAGPWTFTPTSGHAITIVQNNAASSLLINGSSNEGLRIDTTGAGGSYMQFYNSGTFCGYVGSAKAQFSGALGDFAVGCNAGQQLVLGVNATPVLTISATKLGFFGATPVVAPQTGWGTPTGVKVINFPGTTPATLAQTSNSLGALLLYLKSIGLLGA